MKRNKRLLVYLIFQALLMISEAGRNSKPKNPMFPFPGSGPGTRGTSPGRTNSGRASPTQTNVRGNQVSGSSHPNRAPVRPAFIGTPHRFNSQPPATLPLNRPQAPGPLDWSKFRFSGTGPQVRPHNSGIGPQVRPHYSGTGNQGRFQAPGTGPQVRFTAPVTVPQVGPHNSGIGPQVGPHYSGTGNQGRFQAPGTGPQVRFPTPVTVPQVGPHNSGIGPQVGSHYSGTGNQGRFQAPGTRPWSRFQTPGTEYSLGPHNPGTALSVRSHDSGASASHEPQTPVHSSPGTSQMGYPHFLTNDNYPGLKQKRTDFGAQIGGLDRSSLASSSSLVSTKVKPIGLEAPKSTAIMKSVAHPSKCVDNRDTTPKIIAPAQHCFDYFTFAVSWNPGMAYKLWLGDYDIRTDKVDRAWTIHGLWPTMFQKETEPMPGCQRYDITFSQAQFVNNKILGVLDTIWYTLLDKGLQDNKKFWDHEFSKHGSCASRSTVIGEGVNYFKRSLELYHQLDIGTTLIKGGIRVGAIKKLRDIVNVIEKKVGAKVKIDYVYNQNTKENYLAEFQVCYDTDLRVMDCPHVNWSEARLETDIKYLEELPKM